MLLRDPKISLRLNVDFFKARRALEIIRVKSVGYR